MCEACDEMDLYSLYLTKQEMDTAPRPWFCQVIPIPDAKPATPAASAANAFICDEPDGG
jgi:hypothetical protein